MSTFVSIILCGIFIATGIPSQGAPAITVRIDPSIKWTVNGYSEVQRVFGAAVNGTNRDQMADEIRAMNLNGARAYLWPYAWWTSPGFTPAPLTPWAAAQYGGKPLSREDTFSTWDKFYAQDFDSLMEKWWSAAYPKSPMVYQLDMFKNWGLDDGIILHTQLDGSADRHPDDAYRYYYAYVTHLKQHYPMLNFQFVQLTNEPNYSWWSGQFDTTKESVDTWLRVFNRLDGRLRQSLPETQLLGPCLASSEFFSWSGWNNWTVPVLQGVERPMQYFNYHLYDATAYTNLAWLEMLQAKAEALRKPRPLGVVTEMQYRLDEGSTQAWRERCHWWSEQFFMALVHPDKVYEFDNFLLAYLGKHDVFVATNGKYQPTDLYWVYWALANTRGRMLYVAPSDGHEVQSFACAPAADKVVISLFNSGKVAATIKVDPNLGETAGVTSVTRRLAEYRTEGFTHDQISMPATGAPVTVTIEPGGVTSLQWQLTAPLPAPIRTLGEREYYSRSVASPFNKDLPVTIKALVLPAHNETSSLRFAVDTTDLLTARGLIVSFNGHKLPVYWNQAPAQTNADVQSTWWIELPLNRQWVRASNSVIFSHADASYRLMFASLAISQFPSSDAASNAESAMLKYRMNGVFASLKPVGTLLEHNNKPFEVLLDNPTDKPAQYSVSIDLPAHTSLQGCPLKWTGQTLAHTTRYLRGSICAGAIEHVDSGQVSVTVTSALGRSQVLTAQVPLLPARTATYAASPPPIDGTLGAWTHTPPVTYSRPGLSTNTRLAWDQSNLYVAVDVRGKFRPLRPDTVNNFWGKDAIELFVDLNNTKCAAYDSHDWQLYMCPLGVGDDKAFGGEVVRKRQGDDVNIVGTVIDPAIRTVSRVGDDGYLIEASIPWHSLSATFRPYAGMQIGFDIAIDHCKNTDGLGVSDSIFGLPVKAFMSPNKWGVLTLLGKESAKREHSRRASFDLDPIRE